MKLAKMLRRHRWKIVIILMCVAVAAWFIHGHKEELSREALVDFGRKIPAVWFIALYLTIPLAGFPISVFLVLAGIRFGFAGGMAITTVAMFVHNLAAYRLTHGLFRARVRRFLERVGYAIPPIREEHRIWFTATFAAVHGPPYIAKLYLLALTDIPFRIYYWVGTPVYIIFGAIPVGVGSAVTWLNVTWIYVLVGVLAVFPLLGYWLRRRFFGDKEVERF